MEKNFNLNMELEIKNISTKMLDFNDKEKSINFELGICTLQDIIKYKNRYNKLFKNFFYLYNSIII